MLLSFLLAVLLLWLTRFSLSLYHFGSLLWLLDNLFHINSIRFCHFFSILLSILFMHFFASSMNSNFFHTFSHIFVLILLSVFFVNVNNVIYQIFLSFTHLWKDFTLSDSSKLFSFVNVVLVLPFFALIALNFYNHLLEYFYFIGYFLRFWYFSYIPSFCEYFDITNSISINYLPSFFYLVYSAFILCCFLLIIWLSIKCS